jgi:hypothetical protein
MRHLDKDEAKRLNAAKWQLDLLKLNPGYVSWGPHEDYMWTKDGDRGWNTKQILATWKEFGPWQLDDLNECVNFYFSVNRASKECETCGGEGYHPDARPVAESFYGYSSPSGIGWNDKITQDEFEALQKKGRAEEFKTVEACNAANGPGARGIGHDAINRWILIEARLKRLGLPKTCQECEGHGYVFTADKAHASLTLWWLHPRKGCSRGIEITTIEQDDLPAVFTFLRTAAARNAKRFSRLQKLATG